MTRARHLEDALALLSQLVAFRTVTEDSNLDLIDHAQRTLQDVGATCTRTWDQSRDKANLLATIGPDVDGGVVVSGHTDVVPAADEAAWETAPFTASRRDGRVYGRGATDMKGFIACVLAMAPSFAAADLQRPVHVALTFDEEVGCRGAPLLLAELERSGRRPAAAIIGEPTMMQVVTGHKGCFEYTTTITGVAGHGSAPSRGVNAIWHAARFVMQLHELADELGDRAHAESPFDPPGSTLSIGTIRGGEARNVVPDSCWLDWEFRPVGHQDARFVTEAVARIEQEASVRLQALHPDAGIETTTDGEVGGLDTPLQSPAVALARRLLDDVAPSVAPYNTEAGLFQASGIPAIVCGPGSIDVAHRPDEFVEVEQLAACLTMLGRLVTDLSTPFGQTVE